jgi:hypothetical protein
MKNSHFLARTGVLTGGLAIAIPLLAACGASANATCGDWNSYSSSQRKDAAKSLNEKHGQSTSIIKVGVTVLSVDGYCKLAGDDSKIANIFNGNALTQDQ